MGILSLRSTNPNLSFILEKNPATIRESGKAFSKAFRKGVIRGWYNNPENSEFVLHFTDHPSKLSFWKGSEEQFEYLDKERYANPLLPMAMISECLNSASKKLHPLDLPDFETEIKTLMRVVRPKLVHQGRAKEVTLTNLTTNYYEVKVVASTVNEALMHLMGICVVQAVMDRDVYFDLTKDQADKWISIMNESEVGYYPRYLFQVKSFENNQKLFDVFKQRLSCFGLYNLKFGDTRQQRFNGILPYLTGNSAKTLIDIGCGELFQSLKLCKRYETVFAIDADETRISKNQRAIDRKKIENITQLPLLVTKEWVEENHSLFESADVLMAEIIEHIPFEQSQEVVEAVLASPAETVVITVPNADFNVLYSLEPGEFRHPDHHWEPTFEEFCDMAVTWAAVSGRRVEIKGLGDTVKDCSTSCMAIFTQKEIQDASQP